MAELRLIKKEASQGQWLVYGLRDLKGQPLVGGPYLAARVYDEYTADLLVEALRKDAIRLSAPPTPQVEAKVTPPPEPARVGPGLRNEVTKASPAKPSPKKKLPIPLCSVPRNTLGTPVKKLKSHAKLR